MPEGGEEAARAFYSGVLGLCEQMKPAPLASRGGVWFERGALRLHLGVERPFTPARKAHPALEVSDLSEIAERLSAAGAKPIHDANLHGYARFYAFDPFGNRIEFLQPL